jgi:hypothetical protein
MVSHLIAAFQGAVGPEPLSSPKGPMTRDPLRWLVINVLPWPEGKAQSPPELLARQPGAWSDDLDMLRALVNQVGERPIGSQWPVSPAFGKLNGRGWGVLLSKHMDHHLRQFGV